MKRTVLRWTPPLVCLSSALTLLASVPEVGDVHTVMAVLLGVSAALVGVAAVYRRKAWTLRTLSSICSSAGIATMIVFQPHWTAVLGSFIPLTAILVAYGPAFGDQTGPSWDPDLPSRAQAGPGHMAATALAGYLLLAEAVVLQFVESTTSVVLISFMLSLVSVAVIFSVAANREVQLVRTISHAAGLAVQVYISSFEDPNQGLLITCGVISGLLSIPATL